MSAAVQYDHVQLRPDGLAVFDWDLDTDSLVPIDGRIDPIEHLRKACLVAEETTLGDILRWLAREPELTQFLARYSRCRSIAEFIAESTTPPSRPDDGSIEYLEIRWNAEWFTGEGAAFVLEPEFLGVGKFVKDEPDMRIRKGKPTTWLVSYSPVNNIAHLPVRLNRDVRVLRRDKQGGTTLESRRYFSLLDVLDVVLRDIAYVGGPKEKVAFLERLNGLHEVSPDS